MNLSDAEKLPPRIHVLNSVAEVDNIISDYEIEARSAFIVYKKDKSFGSKILNSKYVKVYWERKGKADVTGANQLAFDGIPYVHIGEKILCMITDRIGRHEVNDHCYKRKQTYTQVSKKKNCPAAIHIQQIAKFPNFKVHRDTPFFRATAAKQLHQALNEKKAGNAQMKYLITLPDPSQHRNHITGKTAGVREPVDPIIKEKIVELSHQGVRKVSEMRRHLEALIN
ncbi:unnamed protein product [Porites evermanni]|uniref:Uncharacterized protein n=1 Tax=Porites evermanni TaxID=104178 RepID=A0ABN8LZE6_9CNID|nr:unnamed protein product [Porites evermanni]